MLKNKIFKNASWIIIFKIVQSIFSLIVTMITARYLGPSNFGLINYAASVVAFVSPIVQLGLGNVQVQEFINFPEDEGKIVGTTLVLSFCSAIACFVGVISFARIANAGEFETIVVCALYSIRLLFQGAELLQYWFQAKYLSKYASISSLIAYAVISAYKIYLLVTGKSIYWFAVSNTLDYFIILVLLYRLYKKLGGKALSVSKVVAARMLSKSKYYIAANMMVMVFTQTDRIMLKLMINDAETGYYSAAATCAGLANFVFIAIIDSARPTIFEHYRISKEKFEKSLSMLYSVIIYLSLIMCVIMTVFSPTIIHIIYGQSYEAAIMPLRLVVWYTTFSYIGSIRNIWILAENQQRWLWIINLSGALGNVILNAIWIPIWGVMGAAIASLVTQFFANVVVSYLIKSTRRNTVIMFRGLNFKLLTNYLIKVR